MEGKGYAHAQKPLPYDIGHLHAQVLRGDPAFAEVDQQINMAFIVACMACLDALLDLIADAVHGQLRHVCALKGDDTAQVPVFLLPTQNLQFAADIKPVGLCAAYSVYDQLLQRMTLVVPGIVSPQKRQLNDLRKIGSYIELAACQRCLHL